ncbi:MAG: radical SAM protein [Bacteroidales bacterium]|jgi:wyosine [tRNA(Phe)-imidazoG37] synthetase (radical SAM superfamily)|nr:radical SAM protein [Bacteroidales bacterium]
MATFLFDKIIFGPVKSRRLGVSLGVNLLPVNTKVCSFDCIYCECGLTPNNYEGEVKLPSRVEVREKLEETIIKMVSSGQLPDVITFAGNGEPTLHPEFSEIIDDTVELRNMLVPNLRIAVLSNATMLHKKSVFNALTKIEYNIQKLDSAFTETIHLINCPAPNFNLQKIIDQLTLFNGKVIIQTMFLRESFKEKNLDNTTEAEISAWIKLLEKIKPAHVMIYTIARDTPISSLISISISELKTIALKLEQAGFSVKVSE